MTIPFDVNQQGWRSRKRYEDGTLRPWRPDKTVIHWGGGPNPAGEGTPDRAKEMEVLRGWQRWHIDGRGWFDIAYNYAVGNTGTRYRLRGENRAGATSGDYEPDGIPENHEARAVVWIGGQGQTPTDDAYQAMQTITDAGSDLVIAHRWVKWSTACPGPDWMAWIKSGGSDQMTVKEWIEELQTALNDAGQRDPQGHALVVDGLYGPKTQYALTNGLRTATVPDDVLVKGDTVRLIGAPE